MPSLLMDTRVSPQSGTMKGPVQEKISGRNVCGDRRRETPEGGRDSVDDVCSSDQYNPKWASCSITPRSAVIASSVTREM